VPGYEKYDRCEMSLNALNCMVDNHILGRILPPSQYQEYFMFLVGNEIWGFLIARKRRLPKLGGFKDLLFLPLLGEMIHFGKYFSDGLKLPTRNSYLK